MIDLSRINRTAIAKATGYDVAHISRIFSGKSRPSYECSKAIAEYLSVDINELFETLDSLKGS